MSAPLDTPVTRLLMRGPYAYSTTDVDNFEHNYVDANDVWVLLSEHDEIVRDHERKLLDKQ